MNTPAADYDVLAGLDDGSFDRELARPLPARNVTTDRNGFAVNANLRTIAPKHGEHACEKCRGAGVIVFGYVKKRQGKCFACNGRGYFRTSTADRAKARTNAKARRDAQATLCQSAAREYLAQNQDVAAWFQRQLARGNEFAQSLNDALHKYGALTENQIGAVRRSIIRDQEFAEKRAAESATRPIPPFAVSLLAAFQRAHDAGLKRLNLTIGAVSFSRAPDHGKNPGCLYMKDRNTGAYLGAIERTGALRTMREFTASHQSTLEGIGSDALAAAKLHGQQTGECSCCGRELTDPESIAAGIGPICASKWFG